jgi:hypothetical protein
MLSGVLGGREWPSLNRSSGRRGAFLGSEIEFTLTLPPEITLTESIRVHCKGRVVRVEPAAAGGKIGIAAIIERYEFLAEP